MIKFLTKSFTGLFGTKSERDFKELAPYVAMVNTEFAKLRTLSHDDLRNATQELKTYIAKELKPIDDQIDSLRLQVNENADMDVDAKETIFKKIDALGTERDTELEKVLLKILPTAFAIVKETARRFTENQTIEVTASFIDHELAAKNGLSRTRDSRQSDGQVGVGTADNENPWLPHDDFFLRRLR